MRFTLRMYFMRCMFAVWLQLTLLKTRHMVLHALRNRFLVLCLPLPAKLLTAHLWTSFQLFSRSVHGHMCRHYARNKEEVQKGEEDYLAVAKARVVQVTKLFKSMLRSVTRLHTP